MEAIEEKLRRSEMIREALPACQPQEGSPPNTFTNSELEELQAVFPNMQIHHAIDSSVKTDFNICSKQDWPTSATTTAAAVVIKKEDGCSEEAEGEILVVAPPPQDGEPPQEAPLVKHQQQQEQELDWHGAPNFSLNPVQIPRSFRELVRNGQYTGPTNGQCPGFLQCNLVVLPQGPYAFDFLLFCQRNPKSCPLIEVCDVGSACPLGIAPTADLRTDVPM